MRSVVVNYAKDCIRNMNREYIENVILATDESCNNRHALPYDNIKV